MRLYAVIQGVQIALDALRANKVRAGLTVLGVVIGVATVVTMASLITGIRSSIIEQVESIGRNSFIVNRFDFSDVRIVNDGTPPWAGRPQITVEEARLLEALPSIRTVSPDIDFSAEVRRGSQSVSIQGSANDEKWTDYLLGDFLAGRNFLASEVERSAPLIIISDNLADNLFPDEDPIGQTVRVSGGQFEIVGVYRLQPNLFSGFLTNFAVVPYTAARKYLDVSLDMMALLVVPEPGVTQDQGIEEVTGALRISRGLRPGEDNDFAVISQDAYLETFNQLTGVFFLVMLVLSSIGLMVGGVGVVAIMMISVSERTREIGVRKSLGATRKEILWQFLVESATVTLVGAVIGLTLGISGALILAALAPIPAAVPLWAVAAALAVAIVSGMGFGLYPAWRAANLDPVEALRYE